MQTVNEYAVLEAIFEKTTKKASASQKVQLGSKG